jgi:hypothetical protein
MNKCCALILLLLVTSLTLACGSSNRQLRSITIAQTANGQQIEFVATANFSSSPEFQAHTTTPKGVALANKRPSGSGEGAVRHHDPYSDHQLIPTSGAARTDDVRGVDKPRAPKDAAISDRR